MEMAMDAGDDGCVRTGTTIFHHRFHQVVSACPCGFSVLFSYRSFAWIEVDISMCSGLFLLFVLRRSVSCRQIGDLTVFPF